MDTSLLPAAKPHSSLWDQCCCVPQYRALHFPQGISFQPPFSFYCASKQRGWQLDSLGWCF